MKFLTITLNAAVDVTYIVNRLTPGDVHRPTESLFLAGGKGNNVARVLALRGHDVVATGFAGGPNGQTIERGLREAGIEPRFVSLGDRSSRACISILDESTGHATEILEGGPTVEEADYARLIDALPGLLAGADAVSINGSAPAGTQPPWLSRLAEAIRQRVPRFAVDSSGDGLRALLVGHPDVIKPNIHELAAFSGLSEERDRLIAYAQETLIPEALAKDGRILLSAGKDGATLISAEVALHAPSLKVEFASGVGGGDAMLAGYLEAWASGADDEGRLRRSVAFAASAVTHRVAGAISPDAISGLEERVTIRKLS